MNPYQRTDGTWHWSAGPYATEHAALAALLRYCDEQTPWWRWLWWKIKDFWHDTRG